MDTFSSSSTSFLLNINNNIGICLFPLKILIRISLQHQFANVLRARVGRLFFTVCSNLVSDPTIGRQSFKAKPDVLRPVNEELFLGPKFLPH
jgi:hypothetical protein